MHMRNETDELFMPARLNEDFAAFLNNGRWDRSVVRSVRHRSEPDLAKADFFDLKIRELIKMDRETAGLRLENDLGK